MPPRFGSVAPKCTRCTKSVYPQEMIEYDKQTFHTTCFKCLECKATLSLSAVAMIRGDLFCKNCFKRIFMREGKYSSFEARRSLVAGDPNAPQIQTTTHKNAATLAPPGSSQSPTASSPSSSSSPSISSPSSSSPSSSSSTLCPSGSFLQTRIRSLTAFPPSGSGSSSTFAKPTSASGPSVLLCSSPGCAAERMRFKAYCSEHQPKLAAPTPSSSTSSSAPTAPDQLLDSIQKKDIDRMKKIVEEQGSLVLLVNKRGPGTASTPIETAFNAFNTRMVGGAMLELLKEKITLANQLMLNAGIQSPFLGTATAAPATTTTVPATTAEVIVSNGSSSSPKSNGSGSAIETTTNVTSMSILKVEDNGLSFASPTTPSSLSSASPLDSPTGESLQLNISTSIGTEVPTSC